jgi:hypothetical protein
MQRLLVLLLCALVVTLTGSVLFAAPAKTLPPRPTDSEWDSYREINEAIADPKQRTNTFPENKVQGWLLAQNWLDKGKQAFDLERLSKQGIKGPSYSVSDLRWFKETPFSPTAGPTGAAATSPNTGLFGGPKDSAWQGIKLRQNASEILAIEDPSQDSAKKVEGLQGALFSYARNRLTDGDSWSFQGAFIFPFVWQIDQRLNPNAGLDSPNAKQQQMPDMSHWALISYGAIPSFSIYRVSGIANNPLSTQTKNVDQLTFRVGVFEKLSVPSEIMDTMTLRGYITYLTDSGFDYSAPTGQLEWEPQMFFTKFVTVGYATQLCSKEPALDKKGDIDYNDTSYLAYQLRLRAHADYGTVLSAKDPVVKTGRFLRIGPIAELRFDPVIFKQLSLTVAYQYMPAVIGSNERNSLLTLGSEWKIADNPKTHQSLSLKVTYTEGGLDITKQPVRIVVAGLGGTW